MDVRRRTGPSIQVKTGSKRTCQEKLSCEGSKAEFECRECGTRQCAVCEEKLHSSLVKLASHSRKKIETTSFADGVKLCGMWCYPYNPAEYSCLECKTLSCHDCNRAFHRGKLSKHHRAHLPRPEPNVSQNSGEVNNHQKSYTTASLSESPDIDPFLDALPPPLSLLPPSHPNLEGICTQIKQKQNLEESDEDFMSLESQDDPQKQNSFALDYQLQLERQNSEFITSDEYLSLQSNKQNSLKFLSGHFEGTVDTETYLSEVDNETGLGFIDFIEVTEKNHQHMEEQDVFNISGKGLPILADPVKDFTMSRGMQASTHSDIDQLVIPDQLSEIDRGLSMNPSPSGVSPSSEASLLMLQNVSLNNTPPSSLDSDPGRMKGKKGAAVQGMPRKQRLEQKKDDSQNLKHVTLQTVNIYTQGFLLVNENEELQVRNVQDSKCNIRFCRHSCLEYSPSCLSNCVTVFAKKDVLEVVWSVEEIIPVSF